jgi:hypothetical protein
MRKPGLVRGRAGGDSRWLRRRQLRSKFPAGSATLLLLRRRTASRQARHLETAFDRDSAYIPFKGTSAALSTATIWKRRRSKLARQPPANDCDCSPATFRMLLVVPAHAGVGFERRARAWPLAAKSNIRQVRAPGLPIPCSRNRFRSDSRQFLECADSGFCRVTTLGSLAAT